MANKNNSALKTISFLFIRKHLSIKTSILVYLFRELRYIRDGETEGEGAEGVKEDGGEFTTRDGSDGTTETMERSGEDLDLVVESGKGVSVFDRTVCEGEYVTEALDLPIWNPGKGGMTIGSRRGRWIHDVTGEQEALLKYILAVVWFYPDEDLARDNDTLLDMARTIGPYDKFLLGCHVGLDFVRKAIRIVENLATHEFVALFHLCDVPRGGIDWSLCWGLGHASGARP